MPDSKVSDMSPMVAEDLSDDAVLYLVQAGDDFRIPVGTLKSDLVRLSGDQEIDGGKSFTNPVEVPTATAPEHAVNKGQLETALAGVGGVSNHEALSGIQGGASGEHNHLTNAELSSIPTADQKAALAGSAHPSAGIPSASNGFATTNEAAARVSSEADARQTADEARIVGPNAATDNALVRYDGTTGKAAQDSAAIMGDATLSVFHEGGGETGTVPSYAGTTNGLASVVYGNDADVGAQIGLFRARGTKTTPTAVTLGQRIGTWFAVAFNGTAFKAVAAVRAVATEAHTSLANGTRLVFSVTKNGTVADGALDAKMALQHDGSLTLGGDLTPEPSALVELRSTTQGFLPTRMDTAQRDAIATPATGLHIYNLDNKRKEFWNGIVWVGSGLQTRASAVTVNGSSEAWTDAGIDLAPLDSLGLAATGSIDHGGGVFTDPNGAGSTIFGLPAYSLVGVVMASGTPTGGQAGSFFVGASKGLTNQTGRLWLRFNDSTGTYGGNSGSFAVDLDFYQALQSGTGGDGAGDVVGPASATDNGLARFDATTGKLLQDSPVLLDDVGAFTLPNITTPATPSAGKIVLYAKDGRPTAKDDAGIEYDLTDTGAGGSGSLGASTADDIANLVLWLRRGTATTSLWEDTKNGHDATLDSTLLNAEGPQFDISTSFGEGSAAALPTGATARTLFASFRINALPSSGNSSVVFFYGATSTEHAQGIGIGDDGSARFINFFGWGDDFQITTPLYTGQIYTLAGTFDGTDAKIYLNGVLAGTSNRASWLTTAGGNYQVGRLPTDASHFDGSILEVAVYSRNLSDEEVAALHAMTMTAGSGGAGGAGNSTLEIDVTSETSPLELTEGQAANTGLVFTGTLTAALDVVPPLPSGFLLKNGTTGGYPIQFRSSSVNPKIVVGSEEVWGVFTDGTKAWGKKFDLAAASPSDLTGLFLWLKADSIGVLDGYPISTWSDSSGNGNDALDQDGNPPTFELNVLNGKPGVRFDGFNYLTIPDDPTLDMTDDFTMFIVYKVENSCAIIAKRDSDPDSNWELLTGSAGNNDALRLASFSSGSGSQWNSSLGSPGFNLFTMSLDVSANELRFFRSGVADSSNPITMSEPLVATTSPVYVGCQFTSTGANSPMQGYILEFIGYNRLLTSTERQGVETYLADKYGL